MDSQTLVNAALVLVFVVVGGVFAATEIALISLRESQLSQLEQRGPRGVKVALLARDPNRFLAAVQIGVTVAGFLSAAYGGATLAPDLAPYLERLGLPEGAAESVALVVLTLVIAYLSLVLGELAPKRLALQKAAGLSLLVAPVLDRFATLMRPVIWLLSVSTNAVVRLLGGDPAAAGEELSEEELRDLVTSHEALEEGERRILGDVFAATEKRVKEVMQPRADVRFLEARATLGEAAALVRELPYSRYPVVGDGFDDVVGFLHVRDLLGVTEDRRRVRQVMRPVLMLPATNLLLPSITEMRESGNNLAVVVNEYGGTDGIVTLEDLVEELVGEIRDEYDLAWPGERPDGGTGVSGGCTLDDARTDHGLLLEPGEYDTVAGFVMARLGRIPVVGDRVETGDGQVLEVTEMVGHRVTRLAVRPATSTTGGAAGDEPAPPDPG